MRWRDLRAGDPVWNTGGCVIGEVAHAQHDAVYLQLAQFRSLTTIAGPSIDAPVARLGSLIIRTTKERVQ